MLPPPLTEGADGARGATESERESARESARALSNHFAWTITDHTGAVNYGAGVGLGALRELRMAAKHSLSALDTTRLDDAESFAHLFTHDHDPLTRCDALIITRTTTDSDASPRSGTTLSSPSAPRPI